MNDIEAIQALQMRLSEVQAHSFPHTEQEIYDFPDKILGRVNATLRDVFGATSADYKDFHAEKNIFFVFAAPDWHDHLPLFPRAISKISDRLTNAIDLLTERAARSNPTEQQRALRAYEGLDLHPEIERAAGRFIGMDTMPMR